MADHQFLFSLTVADHSRFDAMLSDLAACVLERVGYTPPEAADILDGLRGTLREAAGGGVHDCDIQFRAAAGELLIVVSHADGREWRIARALPD